MIGVAVRSLAGCRLVVSFVLATVGVACLASCGSATGAAASAASAGWSVLGSGQSGTRSEVPWHAIGSGRALADYWATKSGKAPTGPASLYLVDPRGGSTHCSGGRPSPFCDVAGLRAALEALARDALAVVAL